MDDGNMYSGIVYINQKDKIIHTIPRNMIKVVTTLQTVGTGKKLIKYQVNG